MSLNTNIDKKQNRNIYIFITILCFLLYGNSIKNDYALDDGYVTTTNPNNPNKRIEKGIKGIPEIFTTHYIETSQQKFEYRPIPLCTFAIEYQLFGSNPHVSHFINLLIYIVTCLVLYLLLSRLMINYSYYLPLLITILFVVHPIHTEVVNNIKSRDELLTFLFCIISILFFLKHHNTRKATYLIIASLFYFIALFCKPSAILFVAIIPLTTYFFTEINFKKVLIYFVLPVSIFLIRGLFLKMIFHNDEVLRKYAFFENPLFYEPNFFKRIPMAIYTAGYYFKLMVFPHPLSCYYGYKTIPLAYWSYIFVWIFFGFYVFMGGYAFSKFFKKSVLSYGILVFFIGIFPFLSFVVPVVGMVGERFVYVASYGFCVGLAFLLFKLFKINIKLKTLKLKDIKTSFILTIIVVVIASGIKIINRNKVWKDQLTLFRNDLKNYPNSCNLNYITAEAIVNKRQNLPQSNKKSKLMNEALLYYQQTAKLMKEGLKIYKNDFITINNLGRIYVDVLNKPLEAQPLFRKVIKYMPEDMVAKYNYGYCYEKRNLPDSAIYWYNKQVKNNIKYPPIYIRLHELLYQRRKYAEAIKSDKKAVTLFPNNVELNVNLGNSYILNEDTISAVKVFEKAANIQPLDYVFLQNIADFFKAIGYEDKAKIYSEKSRSLSKTY